MDYEKRYQIIFEQITYCKILIAKLQKEYYELKIHELESQVSSDKITEQKGLFEIPDSAEILDKLLEERNFDFGDTDADPNTNDVSNENLKDKQDSTLLNAVQEVLNDDQDNKDPEDVTTEEANTEEQKKEKPKKERKPRKKASFREKTCELCGEKFIPRWGAQKKCDECMEAEKAEKAEAESEDTDNGENNKE